MNIGDVDISTLDMPKKRGPRSKETIKDVFNTLTKEEKEVVYGLVGVIVSTEEGDNSAIELPPEVGYILGTLSNKQRVVVDFLFDYARKNKNDLRKAIIK